MYSLYANTAPYNKRVLRRLVSVQGRELWNQCSIITKNNGVFPDLCCDHVCELSEHLPVHLLTCPSVLSHMECDLRSFLSLNLWYPQLHAFRQRHAHMHTLHTQAHTHALQSSTKELFSALLQRQGSSLQTNVLI